MKFTRSKGQEKTEMTFLPDLIYFKVVKVQDSAWIPFPTLLRQFFIMVFSGIAKVYHEAQTWRFYFFIQFDHYLIFCEYWSSLWPQTFQSLWPQNFRNFDYVVKTNKKLRLGHYWLSFPLLRFFLRGKGLQLLSWVCNLYSGGMVVVVSIHTYNNALVVLPI